MDDFLSLARDPPVDINKKSQMEAKKKEDERKKKEEEERLRKEEALEKEEEEKQAEDEEDCTDGERESEGALAEEKGASKKKIDRNAPCKPRAPKENPKKNRAKIKYEERVAAEKKK